VDIWNQFISCLRQGGLPLERVQPYDESLRPAFTVILDSLRSPLLQATAEIDLEIHQVGNQIHYLIPLGQEREIFCFSFLVENGEWKLQHIESIILRLDHLGPLPCSVFPDLPEEKKAWIRAEFTVTERVRLFITLRNEKGEEAAFAWFRDGEGYVLAARSWIPFFPMRRAFILYLCWEQSNLLGGKATLERMGDNEALVNLEPLELALYRRTGHLRTMIGYEDYIRLFETPWQDRAVNAGWKLEITYEADKCRMCFFT
jgi:hypothetical protein